MNTVEAGIALRSYIYTLIGAEGMFGAEIHPDVITAIQDNLETDMELVMMLKREDEFDNHDCHLSPDDGCSVCDKRWRGGEIK